jgi:hypothetical protein
MILKLESSWRSEVASDISLYKVVTSDLEPKDGIHFSEHENVIASFTVVVYVEPYRTIDADITDTVKWCCVSY